MSEPGAPDADGGSDSRRLDATPCALSAVHMDGSHAMVSSPPTWPAIQAATCDRTAAACAWTAAACDRTAAAALEERADPPREDGLWPARPDAGTRAACRDDVPVS
jgi:hypothetical protein